MKPDVTITFTPPTDAAPHWTCTAAHTGGTKESRMGSTKMKAWQQLYADLGDIKDEIEALVWAMDDVPDAEWEEAK